MVVQQFDAARELENAFRVLSARWTLALPTAIASLVIAAIVFFMIGTVIVSGLAAMLLGHTAAAIAALEAGATGVAIAVGLIALISTFGHAFVMAAAHEAWADRDPDYSAAFRLTMSRFPSLIVVAFLIALMYAIPVALSFVLIGIPLLFVLGYFLMYARAAIVIGGEDPVTAVATSFRLASSYTGPSLVAFAGIVAAFIIGRIVDGATIHIPGIGLVTAFFVGGATAAYIALVEVRFYDLLRNRIPNARVLSSR
ncbi:MAG TPA: hypothetical protein VHT05_15500 [Candidatus Elarobacter sp.]|nr:hypothetical protein [Candidatus Elarobacter sp.]